MKKALNRGFTLIELLVVIAIIGILASVILASLSTARNKGTDAAVKSDFENARPQAEIYYDGNSNSYLGVCTAATSSNGIKDMMTDIAKKGSYGTGAVTGASAAGKVVCNDSATGWAASAPEKAPTGTNVYWCVDSTGQAKESVTGIVSTSLTTCS